MRRSEQDERAQSQAPETLNISPDESPPSWVKQQWRCLLPIFLPNGAKWWDVRGEAALRESLNSLDGAIGYEASKQSHAVDSNYASALKFPRKEVERLMSALARETDKMWLEREPPGDDFLWKDELEKLSDGMKNWLAMERAGNEYFTAQLAQQKKDLYQERSVDELKGKLLAREQLGENETKGQIIERLIELDVQDDEDPDTHFGAWVRRASRHVEVCATKVKTLTDHGLPMRLLATQDLLKILDDYVKKFRSLLDERKGKYDKAEAGLKTYDTVMESAGGVH